MKLFNVIALTLRRIFTPAPKTSVRPTMIIPNLRDLRDGRQAATVHSQCQLCAKQLAGSLYVWSKPFPGKATVKNWSTDTQSFVGMTIEDFANFVMENFTLENSGR